MEKTIRSPKEWLREIEVEIEPEKLKTKVEGVLAEYKDRIALPGFRPGKVPRYILEKRMGSELESTAVEELVEAAVAEVLSETNLHTATEPRLTNMEVTPEKAIRFQITVEVIPDFELKNYEDLVLKKEEPAGFDEEFERRIQALREKCATFKGIERPAENGDFVVVDYRMTMGETPMGQPKQNVMMEVGDKQASEEANSALLGAKPGDVRTADVALPPDHPNKDMAGKVITYHFTIRDVKERILPEVTEEFAQDLGFDNLDKLRIEVNEEILVDRKRLTENGLKNQIFEYMTREHEFEPPESWVKASMQRLQRDYELPDDEETRKRLGPIAARWAKFDCIVARVASKEDIVIKDEEISEAIDALAENSKSTPEEIARLVDSPLYRNQLLREKVMRFIREKARVE